MPKFYDNDGALIYELERPLIGPQALTKMMKRNQKYLKQLSCFYTCLRTKHAVFNQLKRAKLRKQKKTSISMTEQFCRFLLIRKAMAGSMNIK